MRKFVAGFLCGLFGVGFLVYFFDKEVYDAVPAAPTTTSGAASTTNRGLRAPANQQSRLTVALADSSGLELLQANHDLTSLEVTFAQGSVEPVDNTASEILDITQPTIELFRLRGSGAVAELGTTTVLAGNYTAINLTISTIKGKRANGQIVDVPLAKELQNLRIERNFALTNDVQIVLDIQSLTSVSQSGTNYTWQPTITRVLTNDAVLTSSQ